MLFARPVGTVDGPGELLSSQPRSSRFTTASTSSGWWIAIAIGALLALGVAAILLRRRVRVYAARRRR